MSRCLPRDDALHHLLDDLFHALDLEALADADVLHQLVEQVRCVGDRRLRTRHLVFDGDLVHVGLHLDAGRQQGGARFEFLWCLVRDFNQRRRRRRTRRAARLAGAAAEAGEQSRQKARGVRRLAAVATIVDGSAVALPRMRGNDGLGVVAIHALLRRRASGLRSRGRCRRLRRVRIDDRSGFHDDRIGTPNRRHRVGRGTHARDRFEFGTRGPCAIDHDPLAVRLQREDLLGVLDQESLQQERRIDPRTVEVRDEHADLEVAREDLGGHGPRILCGFALCSALP